MRVLWGTYVVDRHLKWMMFLSTYFKYICCKSSFLRVINVTFSIITHLLEGICYGSPFSSGHLIEKVNKIALSLFYEVTLKLKPIYNAVCSSNQWIVLHEKRAKQRKSIYNLLFTYVHSVTLINSWATWYYLTIYLAYLISACGGLCTEDLGKYDLWLILRKCLWKSYSSVNLS